MSIQAMNELFLDRATPHLLGQQCRACARISFPPNPHGCERCGATAADLSDHPLEGRGRLRAFATTHLSPRRDIPAPFTVAVIELDAGPVVRAFMTCRDSDALAIGDAVRARIVVSEDGARQLRFEPAEKA